DLLEPAPLRLDGLHHLAQLALAPLDGGKPGGELALELEVVRRERPRRGRAALLLLGTPERSLAAVQLGLAQREIELPLLDRLRCVLVCHRAPSVEDPRRSDVRKYIAHGGPACRPPMEGSQAGRVLVRRRARRSARGRRTGAGPEAPGARPRAGRARRRDAGSPRAAGGRTGRRGGARARRVPRSGARSPRGSPRVWSCP